MRNSFIHNGYRGFMNKENYFYENYDLTKNGQGYVSASRNPFTAVSSRFDNEITDEQATAQLHKQARAGLCNRSSDTWIISGKQKTKPNSI